jgi:hypothetical protein
LLAELDRHTTEFKIRVLRACVERLPWYRADTGEIRDVEWKIGSLLYELVAELYRCKLPFAESDLVDLLHLSRHDCGHGCDVNPPFQLAVAYAAKRGLTPELLAGIREYVSALKGTTSTQAQTIKRRAALLYVLDKDAVKQPQPCWSERFRLGLRDIPAQEAQVWVGLVMSMNTNDVYTITKSWRRSAEQFIARVGEERVVERLTQWWPTPDVQKTWPIGTGGSHLLKHFVWLLDAMPTHSSSKPAADELVCTLSQLDWKPRERAAKVMLAAGRYLAGRSPDVSWIALQNLAQWPGLERGELAQIAAKFAETHQINGS